MINLDTLPHLSQSNKNNIVGRPNLMKEIKNEQFLNSKYSTITLFYSILTLLTRSHISSELVAEFVQPTMNWCWMVKMIIKLWKKGSRWAIQNNRKAPTAFSLPFLALFHQIKRMLLVSSFNMNCGSQQALECSLLLKTERYKTLKLTKVNPHNQALIYKNGASSFQTSLSLMNYYELCHHSWITMNHSWAIWAEVFDVSKDFDKVWHDGLLHKCKLCGILGQIFCFTSSFLSNR